MTPAGQLVGDRWQCPRCRKTGYHNKRLCPLFPDVAPYPPEEKRPECICGAHECQGPSYGEACPMCRGPVVEGEGAKRCAGCGWTKRTAPRHTGRERRRRYA